MAAGTLLPLFWELASSERRTRIDSSVKLISALQQFQEKFLSETKLKADSDEGSEDEEEHDEKDKEHRICSRNLAKENAADVSYAVRRLIRGLASPRESSRLGFAVGLTELLRQIDTVSCHQILILLKKESQPTGSMSGQEERDMLFARLFGLKAIIQSGLLVRKNPLRMSTTSASSLEAFGEVLSELLSLGEKKSWLRESCWWTLAAAIDKVNASDAPWKQDAFDMLYDNIYINDPAWGLEKIAVTLQLQRLFPEVNWSKYCGSFLKSSNILSPANFPILARLLKDSVPEEGTENEHKVLASGPWKPQLHFAWNVFLDALLGPDQTAGRFQDFYRVVVDEALFSTTSSPQRKYWGFQVFQSALYRLPPANLPMLFTKNFMRTWINHLSKSDRYLHKLAHQVANDLQKVVEKDTKAGFTLVLQLMGTNGSFHFDRVTKTKTVETILSKMDTDGIKEYVEYLLQHFNKEDGDMSSSESRRTWIVEQISALLRKGTIPKDDDTICLLLTWLATVSFFDVKKSSKKSANLALRSVPNPSLSKGLQELCRTRLLACLADLANVPLTHGKNDDAKKPKVPETTTDGDLWIPKVLKLIIELEKDVKHVSPCRQVSMEEAEAREGVMTTIKDLELVSNGDEIATGSELLLSGLLLKSICDEEADWELVTECVQAINSLVTETGEAKERKKKKQERAKDEEDREAAPIDLLVDIVIGLLENSTSFTRTVANQSFAMLTPLMTSSTVGLILAQLERRNPSKEEEAEDDEITGQSNDASVSGLDEEGSGSGGEKESDENSEAEEDTGESREALGAVIAGDDLEEDGEDLDEPSDEESMDDEQMMAIDEKLAAVFRTRQDERKKGKDTGAQREATYFKNRVLDLVDLFLKKQSSNVLTLRFILPLVEIITSASNDEKQLSDKAKGIIRSRYAKPKDVPSVDNKEATAVLESLHKIARKAHFSEAVSSISICSLFVTKILTASGEQDAQTQIYEESARDFITRKASGLNMAFIIDFIRRYPLLAWSMRDSIMQAVPKASNGYRQTQAFNIVQTLVTQLPQQDMKKDEVMPFLQLVSDAFLACIADSCLAEKPLMTTAQMKEALKCAFQMCRFTKRFVNEKASISSMWQPKKWSNVAEKLSESEKFKGSVSLAKTCQQISRLANDSPDSKTSTKKAAKTALASEVQTKPPHKRKQEKDAGNDTDSELRPRKPKRKKVRKIPKDTV